MSREKHFHTGIIDRKQFIVMREMHTQKDYLHINLGDSFVLSYHKELSVLQQGENVLIGHAYDVRGGAL